MKNMLCCWRFEDAPKELQALSTFGGDEDWVLLIPPGFPNPETIGWAEVGEHKGFGGGFGSYRIEEHKLPDGSLVRIGSH